MLTLLPFLIKLNENIKKSNNRINEYIKNPNEKQIHDIRTSIRRLDSAFLTLPKRFRRGTLLSEYNLNCKILFKLNSEIRDYDILIGKLQKYPKSTSLSNVIETIKNNRQQKLEDSKNLAVAIKRMDTSRLVDRMDLTEREIKNRYNKIITDLVSKLEKNFVLVIYDSSKLDELHELRKDCKKLRYLLELLPQEDKQAFAIRKILQKLQDILGEIHDFDITIDFLKSLEFNKEIQEVINNEIEQRKIKYQDFLKFCKRRLDISQDSFLIKVQNFLSR